MSTFLLLNPLPFARALEEAGHIAVEANFSPLTPFTDILIAFERKYGKADYVVLTAMGNTPLPRHLNEAETPIVLVALDSCLNEFWLREYAPLFDAVFVDQRSSVLALAGCGTAIIYLPLSVPESNFVPPAHKVHDFVFVGRCQAHRIKRLGLLALLRKHFQVHVVGENGEYISVQHMQELFARSKVVINENLFSGLTLRVLQAMASGSLLFSESNPAMEEYFCPSRHFISFNANNVLEQAALALHNANNAAQHTLNVAAAGRKACLAGHTHNVRAKEFLSLLPATRHKKPAQQAFFAQAAACYALSLRYTLPEYRAFAMEALATAAPQHAGAALLYARARARGHTGRQSVDASAFLRAAKTMLAPANWQAALCLGYALIRFPEASLQLEPATAFALARALANNSDANPEFDDVEAVLKGPDQGWPLDMAMARLCMALGLTFETGFGKVEEEILPQNAAEYLVRVLARGENPEARLLLAACYERCGLVGEAAWQYRLLAPCLEYFPEAAMRAAQCNKECYLPLQ